MYLTGTDITENEVGVFLDDVTSLRVFGGQINYNGIGIRAPLTTFSDGANISNIFLFSHAKVNNNDIGIEVEKGGEIDEDEYYGMVLMDCAELYGNGVGITGEDVILQIDAYMNAGGGDLRPNKIHDNEVSFDICYIDLSAEVSTLTPAKGNYWGSTWPPTNNKVNKTNCGTWGGLDTSLPVTTEPTSCNDGGLAEPNTPKLTVNPGFTGNPSEMCSLNIGGSNIDVHEEFIDAYDHFRAGWHTLAGQKFEPIASITGNDHLNASAMCKQYINVAKVMARGVPLLLMPINDNHAAESQDKATSPNALENTGLNMKVYPNPTRSQFLIELQDGEYAIKIVNLLGIERYFTIGNSSVEISTSDWQAGIYWIEVVDLQTKEQLNGKVVVQ